TSPRDLCLTSSASDEPAAGAPALNGSSKRRDAASTPRVLNRSDTEGGISMTNDDPVDLYIAAYSDPAGAGRDWADLKRLEQDGVIALDGLVLVSRDRYGKIHIEDSTHDV